RLTRHVHAGAGRLRRGRGPKKDDQTWGGSRVNKLRFLLIGSASVLAFTDAHAQAARQQQSTQLGEIVVTAQRRAQNVLSVPVAITATTGTQLQAGGIKQISALQFNTPGFFTDNGVGYTQVYIRGIGNNIFVGADPSVATFIDDVPRVYG